MHTPFPVLLFAALVGLCTAVPGQGFDAVIFSDGGPVILFDQQTSQVTTVISQRVPQIARGGMIGADGMIYASECGVNGIGVLNPRTGVWESATPPGRSVSDPSDATMGFPYQPAPNFENVGGFGIVCLDGNTPRAPAPPWARNTFTVDYSQSPPAWRLDGWFQQFMISMTDFYPSLFRPETFDGIGFYTLDRRVLRYKLLPFPDDIQPAQLGMLPQASRFDATPVETGEYAVLTDDAIMFFDPRTGQTRTVTMTGVPNGFGAIWSDGWERPGMMAWICGSTPNAFIYRVDLAANPIKVLQTTPLPAGRFNITAGRHVGGSQLTAWRTSKTTSGRNLHINFGRAAAGQVAVVVPSLKGLARQPTRINGLDIYLTLDDLARVALGGFAGYDPAVRLDQNGEGDVVFPGAGLREKFPVWWQAATFGAVNDASNLILTNQQ